MPVRDRVAPPAEPPDLDVLLTDEGPMRRELLAQIEQLGAELDVLRARVVRGRPPRVSPRRGPRVLDTADLEQIRDELVEAITRTVADASEER